MKKVLIFNCAFAFFLFLFAFLSFAQENLLLDDFEAAVSGGWEGTVDFGAGNGSSVEVAASSEIKNTGNQSIKVTYDAQPDGYIYVAKGFNLDAVNAAWLVKPEDIGWIRYGAISFYIYGSNSKVKVAVDLKDNGGEMWRFLVEDDFSGWKQIICPFNNFFARDDWQPNDAERNAELDFPIRSFQFEPRPDAQAKSGILYFDTVELTQP
ncbi:MAG: hypothetical protein JW788_04980 [Candidatus Omnitrophica bacterium]|nr:hypothetical protein [Candidatus Omnitrophota bacterium]